MSLSVILHNEFILRQIYEHKEIYFFFDDSVHNCILCFLTMYYCWDRL